jgi:hypothetical protein
MNFLNNTFYGNTLTHWLAALLTMAIVVVIARILTGLVLRRLSAFAKKTKTDVDDLVADLLKRTRWFLLLFISLYVITFIVILPEIADRVYHCRYRPAHPGSHLGRRRRHILVEPLPQT